ncbi:Mu transposase C-terminal domain-containing protein [Viridibacillus arvi]|uniref:Mu transposase C-terminal domain-containing protein n=1 Tax=Viridibacillus arvi TaxID=263475 RepID=UPI0036F15F99
MKIYNNEIFSNETEGKRYRVLWIDNDYKFTFLIDVEDEHALPIFMKVDGIIEDLVDGELIKVHSNTNLVVGDESISKSSLEKRDKAWNMIKDAVVLEPDIYISDYRGKIIKEIVKKYRVSNDTIYKYLRRYWQAGKSTNGLIPRYMKSGGRGKKKNPKRKMGRPSKFKELQSNVVVDEDMKKTFRIALQKYYFNEKKNSLPFTYKMMIRRFFAQNSYYENDQFIIEVKEKSELPSMDQLRYFLKTEYSDAQKKKSREGQTKFDKSYRELMGSSTFESFGPGSRFQIDATIADVYLVSEYNPDWIIGRPVFYNVIDVFSRLIVGIYVGLEGPSWLGAMMALANTVDNKVDFCKKYDIDITNDEWPSEHLPQLLLADRGEFEGYNAERLVNIFNLHVENAAPFRADWKGIVEKYFDIIQTTAKPFLPGYVEKDFNERGAKDYRLDAKLTIKDFTKVIIREVIYHNNNNYLKNYPRDLEMINDEVEPIPISLWNWGIKNRSGSLIYHTPDTVKLHLLPQKNVSITKKGIRFNGKMHYSCETAIKESWFSKARIKGSWGVKVAYDPRDMTQIYLLKNNSSSYEECYLLEHQEERYKNKSLVDIDYLLEMEEYMAKKNEHPQLESEINLVNKIEDIIKPAAGRTEKQQNHSLSKTQKVKSISDNRAYEKEFNRKREKFVFAKQIPSKTVTESENNSNEINYNRKSIKEILQKSNKEVDYND